MTPHEHAAMTAIYRQMEIMKKNYPDEEIDWLEVLDQAWTRFDDPNYSLEYGYKDGTDPRL